MPNYIKNSKASKLLIHSILVIIGNICLAAGISCFAVPAHIILGGASGLTLVMQKFIPISLSQGVLVINIIALVVAFFFLGKSFVLGTLVSTFAFPFFLEFFERNTVLSHLTNDVLLAAIYSALLCGLGLGIIFRVGYSTGGLDIPPIIISKYTGFPVGTLINVLDVLILLGQIPFSNIENILYGIIQVLICGYIINQITIFGENNVQVIVISEYYQEIKDMIFNNIDRGCTLLNITTGYMKKEGKAVMVVLSRREYALLTENIQEIDPNAFIIASEVHSVKGRGFTLPSIDL